MNDGFYRAQLPETRIVLGLPLLPLSLGHLILLNRMESAFLTGGNPDFSDLAVSVLICSQTYEEGLASFEDPDMPKFMRLWHDRITGNNHWLIRLGVRRPHTIDFLGACSAFIDYLSEHIKGPNYSYDPGQFKSMDCPSEQIIKIALMRDLHLTESQALNRSWRLCLWDYAVLRALAGQVELVDDENIRAAQETAQRLMQLVKEGKINGHNVPAGQA